MILSLILAATVQTTTPPAPSSISQRQPVGMQRADANGDGIVTRAEVMAQADAMFARMDSNRDGKVTADERRAAMEAMRAERRGPGNGGPGGRGMGRGGDRDQTLAEARTRAAERFDRFDANKDGRLDAAELSAARPRPMRGRGDGTPPPPGE